ncbi:MAG: universal stress protein [Gammaproteobacteria bacterium]|jgi:universal stress protein A
MSGYAHVLAAVDFSAAAQAVARRALELSRLYNARLSLIHVVEFVPLDLSNEMVVPQGPEIDQELLQLAERRLSELAADLGVGDNFCQVRHGNTRREILRAAEQEAVDLIVIGSHGREGIQLLLGSTANAVLHGAPCDVLAVRVTD